VELRRAEPQLQWIMGHNQLVSRPFLFTLG